MTKTKLLQRPKHYWRKFALRYLGVCGLLFFIAIPLFVTYLSAHPQRYAIGEVTPADLGLTYEAVSFPALDGVRLAGWYVPSQNGAAVVAVHANGGNRTGMLYHARALANQGYGVLLLDLRGFGESDGCLCPVIGGPVQDVRGAVAYLQQRADVDPDRIGALGVSLGAMAALRAAAEDDHIRAVLADGLNEVRDLPPEFETAPWPIREYVRYIGWVINRLNGEGGQPLMRDVVGRIAPRAVYLIAAGPDYEKQDNRDVYAAAGEPKQLWELPDTPHIAGIVTQPDEYEAKMLAFFQETLLSGK